jgi:hypothetical protein
MDNVQKRGIPADQEIKNPDTLGYQLQAGLQIRAQVLRFDFFSHEKNNQCYATVSVSVPGFNPEPDQINTMFSRVFQQENVSKILPFYC